MKFELKNYKFFKIKHYLKKNHFFLFFNGTNLNLKNWIEIEQKIKNSNLKFFKIHNKLFIKSIKNSTYKNIKPLINGIIIILKPNSTYKPKVLKFKNIINISPLLTLLSIKLNNKFYSIPQLKNIIFLNFRKTANILYKSLKIYIKMLYNRLKNIKLFEIM